MPNFTFTGPNGQQITVTGPDGATPAQAFAIAQQHMQKPPEGGSRLLGGLEGDFNALGKAVSSIPAGVAGAAGLIKGALTPGENAGDTGESWMNATNEALNKPRLTLGTPESQQGQATQEGNAAAQQGIGGVMNALPWLAEKGADFVNKQAASGNPTLLAPQLAKSNAGLQFLGNLGANIAPMAGAAKTVDTDALQNVAQNAAPIDTPLSTARGMGYSIMPSEAAIKGGSAPVGKLVEGLAGSAKTGVSAVMKNQPITNSLAASDIAKTAPDLGITSKTELTPQLLDQARSVNNAVYAKVSSLGSIPTDAAYKTELANVGRTPGNSFPGAADPDIGHLIQTYNVPKFDAADAVLQIRNLRKNATANYKASAANQVKNAPMLGELADAQQSIADALENQLDRHVGSPADKVGNPKLIQDWRQARKNLAVINTVDNAIKEGTTDVSAEALAKQLNRGAPLSGNLQKIADMQNNFPISIRDVTRVRNKVPINALEGIMGTAGLGSAVLGEPHLGAGLVAGMIARPIARTGLLSSAYQNALLPKAPLSPFMQSLIPAAGIGAAMQGNKP